jgi:uncharacterized protein (DUF302 family)
VNAPMKAIAAAVLMCATIACAADEYVAEVTTSGTFDDVKQQLVLAIENHGLVVNHESKVGEMLERTGKDLGAVKQIYVRAELIEFCSAALSRQVMEADARLLAFCPFGVGIYVLPGEEGKVHLVYRRPRVEAGNPAAQSLQRVDQLLHDIVQEAGQ